MKKKLFSVFLFAACLSLASCGDNKETDSKEVAEEQNEVKHDDTNLEKDSEFAVNAANGGMTEVEASKLAVAQATSPQVKQFAQEMITDHTKANEELMALAQTKNITLPATLSEDKQKDVTNLSEKKGADFDKAYMDMMVSDHEKTVDLFQKEADNGTDPDAKNWAATTLPKLQHHLEMAKMTRDAVKK